MIKNPGHYQIVDPQTKKTYNMFDPDKKPSIWDPGSAFMNELELYKLRSEIKPRKTNMMASQIGMIDDMCKELVKPKLYIPNDKGFIK